MPKNNHYPVADLHLDLNNYRIVPQKTEAGAISALMAIKKNNYFSIMNDLVHDGFSETENIIVLNDNGKLIVKEGNRRISMLKLMLQIYDPDDFDIPETLKAKIKDLTDEWKEENKDVPCSVYEMAEIEKVKKIIRRTHGKGEESARSPWGSVAKARINKIESGAAEHGLTILESYLINGKNLTQDQRDEWGGEYPLTVLDDALRKTYSRIGEKSVQDMVTKYPKIKFRNEVEKMLCDIGTKKLKFPIIRDTKEDFLAKYYNIPDPNATTVEDTTTDNGDSGATGNDNSGTSDTQGSSTNGANDSQTGSNGNANDTQGGQGSNTGNTGTSSSPMKNNPNRTYLIISTYHLNTTNTRLAGLFDEMKRITTKFDNTKAAVLRVFLDIAVHEFIDAEGLKAGITAHYQLSFEKVTLSNRLEYIKSVGKKLKSQKAKNIVDTLLKPGQHFSLDVLNGYIHGNGTHYINKQFLNSFWDFMFPLFEEILDISEKK